MPGLFESLKNMPKREPKKFFITVQGVKHEVTLERKLWSQQHSEENLIMKDGKIVVKPKPIPKTKYSILKKASKGYTFQDSDIHWPNAVVEGGMTWLIERE